MRIRTSHPELTSTPYMVHKSAKSIGYIEPYENSVSLLSRENKRIRSNSIKSIGIQYNQYKEIQEKLNIGRRKLKASPDNYTIISNKALSYKKSNEEKGKFESRIKRCKYNHENKTQALAKSDIISTNLKRNKTSSEILPILSEIKSKIEARTNFYSIVQHSIKAHDIEKSTKHVSYRLKSKEEIKKFEINNFIQKLNQEKAKNTISSSNTLHYSNLMNRVQRHLTELSRRKSTVLLKNISPLQNKD